MPSDAKNQRGEEKKEEVPATNGTANGTNRSTSPTEDVEVIDHAAELLKRIEIGNAQARSVAGILSSDPKGLDHKVDGLTVTFYGTEIVTDTKLELNRGRRYGIIGLTGSGKSTLMHAIYNHELPIPESVDTYLVSREMCVNSASELTALRAVIDVDKERKELERLAEKLASCEDNESREKLMDVIERLDEMDSSMAEKRAAELLHGLGFTKDMQMRKCTDFTGGCRMRIALARALYLKPSILLLDEPTKHLDQEACVWLKSELAQYKRTLLIVSHSQDFMNSVCTDVIHLSQKKLVYYSGNYDQFVKTREKLLENPMNNNAEQAEITKEYVARVGHGSANETTIARIAAGRVEEEAVAEACSSTRTMVTTYTTLPTPADRKITRIPLIFESVGKAAKKRLFIKANPGYFKTETSPMLRNGVSDYTLKTPFDVLPGGKTGFAVSISGGPLLGIVTFRDNAPKWTHPTFHFFTEVGSPTTPIDVPILGRWDDGIHRFKVTVENDNRTSVLHEESIQVDLRGGVGTGTIAPVIPPGSYWINVQQGNRHVASHHVRVDEEGSEGCC